MHCLIEECWMAGNTELYNSRGTLDDGFDFSPATINQQDEMTRGFQQTWSGYTRLLSWSLTG